MEIWKYVLVYFGFVVIIFLIVGVDIAGDDSTLLVMLLSVIPTVLVCIPLTKMDAKKEKEIKATADFTDVTGYSGYLTVHSRSPITRNAVNTYAVRDVTLNYTPDKYIYTSATVGGITTGGVSKIDGGYSAGLGGKTGTYNLWYKKARPSKDSRNLTGWDGEVIYSVVLNDLRLDSVSSERYLPNSLKVLDLSKSTADYVLSWICGEVDKNSSNENSNKNITDMQANTIKTENKSAIEKSIERHNKKIKGENK